MEDFRYDTYCGLYCGACDILNAYKKGLESNQTPDWNTLPAKIQKHIKPAPIQCLGCKSDVVFKGCSKCPIRKCARKKQNIDSCIDCKNYPCLKHKISNLVKKFGKIDKKLPHLKIIPQNLKTLKEKGKEFWMEEQKRIWKCPECSTDFTWYQAECSQCGKNLVPIKDYNQDTE